mmetsp:Transcript_59920/g.106591  ORF Transcript_59920/g.106591 Transcript_59920/m.106591 type:complete len:281 (+) Transcript_59920:586-1428(+)
MDAALSKDHHRTVDQLHTEMPRASATGCPPPKVQSSSRKRLKAGDLPSALLDSELQSVWAGRKGCALPNPMSHELQHLTSWLQSACRFGTLYGRSNSTPAVVSRMTLEFGDQALNLGHMSMATNAATNCSGTAMTMSNARTGSSSSQQSVRDKALRHRRAGRRMLSAKSRGGTTKCRRSPICLVRFAHHLPTQCFTEIHAMCSSKMALASLFVIVLKVQNTPPLPSLQKARRNSAMVFTRSRQRSTLALAPGLRGGSLVVLMSVGHEMVRLRSWMPSKKQ